MTQEEMLRQVRANIKRETENCHVTSEEETVVSDVKEYGDYFEVYFEDVFIYLEKSDLNGIVPQKGDTLKLIGKSFGCDDVYLNGVAVR